MKSIYKDKSVSIIFKKYISTLIPKVQTNIIFTIFNGIDELFSYIEFKINSYKREGNFLTAQNVSSLRNLAAKNGFEPKLKVPSRGFVKLQFNQKLFQRVGFPIYLPGYSIFLNKINGLEYYYESDKMLRIDKNEILIPIVEGIIRTRQFVATVNDVNKIERFYIDSNAIAENSIKLTVNNIEYKKVKSFMDNDGINNNRLFMIKYSNDSINPIILYIKGVKQNDIVNVTYRDCSGEYGNLNFKSLFETQEFLDNKNNPISISDDEISIYNVSGFNFGSDGSDVNSLRSAIGFNHGVNLLFDEKSYEDFINKYSNILLQKIKLSKEYKAIKFIYISKKVYLNPEFSIDVEYKNTINFKHYLLTQQELQDFSVILDQSEYALSSHNLYNSETIKYALQIKFDIKSVEYAYINNHKLNITKLLYFEFSKFLYNKYHQINLESLLNNYMIENDIKLEYTMFSEDGNIIYGENTTIKHTDKLPILKGDFNINGENNTLIKLFNDINWVIS